MEDEAIVIVGDEAIVAVGEEAIFVVGEEPIVVAENEAPAGRPTGRRFVFLFFLFVCFLL